MKLKKKKYSFLPPEKYKTGEALRGSAKPQERDADAGRAGHPPVSVSITVSRRQAAEPRAAADPARGQAAGNARQQTAARTLPGANPAAGNTGEVAGAETPAVGTCTPDISAKPKSTQEKDADIPGAAAAKTAAELNPAAAAGTGAPAQPESLQDSGATVAEPPTPAEAPALTAQPKGTREKDADIPGAAAPASAAAESEAATGMAGSGVDSADAMSQIGAEAPAAPPESVQAVAAETADRADSANPPSAPVPAAFTQPGNVQGNAAAGTESPSGAEVAADGGTNAAKPETTATFKPRADKSAAARPDSTAQPAVPAQPKSTQESGADIPASAAGKTAAELNPAAAAAEQGRGGDSASPPSAPVPAVAAQPGNIQGNAAAGAEASSGAEAAADSGTNAAKLEAAATFVPVAPASPTTGLEAETAAAVDIPPADSFWRRLIAPANLAFLLLALLLMGPIYLVNYALGDLYYLHEDGEQVAVLFSRAQTDAAVFEQAGIALHEADRIDRAPFGDCTHLTVTRAFTVDVTADGETRTLRLLDKTTADALAQLGIRLEPDDLVDPPLTHRLVPGESVRVTRVRYETREALEEVPWQEVDKPSPLIAQGRTQVMNAGGGRDGLAQRVYRDKYVDGVLAQSELVEEQYEDFPWNVVTLVGDDDAVMSPLDGAAFTDVEIVDNAPTSYERVLENAVCTAYSFKPGTYGASGMYMFQGFVAVNTNVIPYGSLLYITSPTGQFTYGWAIAADVGEAMMAGYVDIDLFFETYTESALFGKHRMNVYVVDQLTQAELEQFMAQPGMFRSRIPAD